MKKFVGAFFLLTFLFPVSAFAQTVSVSLPGDYKASIVLDNLQGSQFFTFDFEGNFVFTKTQGKKTQIIKITPSGEQTVLLDHATEPITGLSFHAGLVYVSMKAHVAALRNGRLRDVVSGLPAYGDYGNSPVIFENGRMFFSVGTMTNSGVVGLDNAWAKKFPSLHDLICEPLKINQTSFVSDNILTKKTGDQANTGPFQPFNTQAYSDTLNASEKCNGSILSTDPDGSDLQIVAYGLHNPKGISFDSKGNMYTLDSAMEDRGTRPVKGGRDSLFEVAPGLWYGWPDFNAGTAIDNTLIKDVPNLPPKPETTFDPGHLTQFVVNQFDPNSGLAIYDENKIVEFGLNSGKLTDFLTPASNSKVTQMKFGPDGNLYVLVNDGKISKLYSIEQTKKATPVLSSVSQTRSLPLAWSISLTTMFIGLLATYLVHQNNQKSRLGF